jgi:CRISPR/Cas system-associated exonuclease Cas4 (RecB family)
MEENYFQKLNTQEDLPVELLTDFFCEDLECRDVDWSGDVDLSTAKDQGVVGIRSYQDQVACGIQPARVEYAFTIEVTGRPWSIMGKIDVIDDGDRVIETKTTTNKVHKAKKAHVFQAEVYATAFRREAGLETIRARVDYSLRAKEGNFHFSLEFDASTERNVLITFDSVANAIQKEIWIPNRNSNYCTRRFCAYWDQCEKDCGGIVAA